MLAPGVIIVQQGVCSSWWSTMMSLTPCANLLPLSKSVATAFVRVAANEQLLLL